MAQAAPSNLAYAQAMQAISTLRKQYSTSQVQTPQQIAELINSTLSKFGNTVGKTQTPFDPVVLSEIPTSAKMNRFWFNLQSDINLIQNEVDLLRASAIFMHNYTRTEILKASNENRRIQNKIKTLELYSSISDGSLLYFGDNFTTEDFIDWNLVSTSDRATLLGKGNVALSLASQESVLDTTSSITILNDSNGFIGNNQEVSDPYQASTDPVSGQKSYTFISQTNKSNNLRNLLDDAPNTWFEFEKYLVSPADRANAKNFNFEYRLTGSDASAYLSADQSGGSIPWADGLVDGVLRFSIEIDLGADKQVNTATLLPYGLQDNKNNPIRIVQVSVSLNGTDWTVLGPENVWISNSIDKKISTINAENILIGSATWITNGDLTRYVRFEIEQSKPVDCNIGHLYYVAKTGPAVDTPNYNVSLPMLDPSTVTYDMNIPFDSPIYYLNTSSNPVTPITGSGDASINTAVNQDLAASQTNAVADSNYRELGPVPPVDNPQLYYGNKNAIVNNLIQKTEYFNGKRWVIGIRDINIKKNTYNTKGTLVSQKFNIPGIVDRVALEADVYIPESYPDDTVWVKFYVSPNDGLSWYQISRIQDDFLGIPEILAFNDPTPNELREAGVGYQTVKGTVDSLRLKVEITRPDGEEGSTPIVRSYKLKVIKRK